MRSIGWSKFFLLHISLRSSFMTITHPSSAEKDCSSCRIFSMSYINQVRLSFDKLRRACMWESLIGKQLEDMDLGVGGADPFWGKLRETSIPLRWNPVAPSKFYISQLREGIVLKATIKPQPAILSTYRRSENVLKWGTVLSFLWGFVIKITHACNLHMTVL